MTKISVSSSNLESVGYISETALLEIDFKDGSSYQYFDVPQFEYDNLMAADSKGSYANQNIYTKYRSQRIR